MSFYTSLDFYRPCTPPVITGQSLAKFIKRFEALEICTRKRGLSVEIKFGKGIDEDEKPSLEYEQIHKLVWAPKDFNWDVQESCSSLKAVTRLLLPRKEHVYRAFIELGWATSDICKLLTRGRSPDNEAELHLDGWALEIGPIISTMLGSEDRFFVGWIRVGISGYGYLFPWTFQELVERADSHPGIGKLKDLCRTTWPIKAKQLTRREKEMRERMKEEWPYDKKNLPWDWYWGINETG